jgi:HEAT repeat protein
MRMSVLAQLSARRERHTWRAFWEQAGAFVRARPVGSAVLVTTLVAAAVLAGRWSARPAGSADSLWMRAIERQATAARGVAGYWDAPLTYSNVIARSLGDGRLDLSFDVSRHVDLVTPGDSEVARDVLVHAILEPSPMGTRLKAMTLTRDIMDARLREAVVFTLHHDPSLAVRLAALAVLSDYPFDGAIQEALLVTLREDESVLVRLRALEHLAAHRVSPDALHNAIDAAGLESDTAVRQRAAELMQQL